MTPHPQPWRPITCEPRDLLVGVLACTAIALKRPTALDEAARLCAPMFDDPPAPANWHPELEPDHALAAIAYAGRALRLGAFTRLEYDFVCGKARRSLVRGLAAWAFPT